MRGRGLAPRGIPPTSTASLGVRRRCYTAAVKGGGASWGRLGRGIPRLGMRLDKWP
jgi:hypothetical protein